MSIAHDQVFIRNAERASDFEFNAEVAQVFDDMIQRSVPYYEIQQEMIREIGKKFYIPGTRIYDLGCSTATTLINLCQDIGSNVRAVGYDNSLPMLDRSQEKIKQEGLDDSIELRFGDLNGDLTEFSLENGSIVTMCWTLQFVRPLRRDNLIKHIYNGLVENGVLVITEKILTNSSPMNRFFIDFYYDYKRRNGYSEEEILRKREALENVLIPYRVDENFDLFRQNGFEIVETFFQWYNFAGFLCVKKPV
ncbi:carboxy-S-adenosyl-L-methionine synthase CmoA [Chloroflexi bacterium TSY]|nr:carboxy-S-adenosyl-L-methionine synthase CmoA [Chloroflexi bacterium TSY]